MLTFGGSAVVALALLPVGAALGILHDKTPGWTWVTTILLIDVAHVYATGFRVYFDIGELKKRPWLYTLTPALAFGLGVAVYSESVGRFWTILAYLAVFHFIRQQYGWVALYRARERECYSRSHDDQAFIDPDVAEDGRAERLGWWIDASAIYLATIYPLVVWHASSPRQFHWFVEGDFFQVPAVCADILRPIYWCAMAAYVIGSLHRGWTDGHWNPGKDLVVLTTAVCWYVGIITFNSDYAFTVTNVIIHGVPYMVLIYWYRWHRVITPSDNAVHDGNHLRNRRWTNARRLTAFLGIVWMLAYAEELLWDAGTGERHAWLFGWFPMGESIDPWTTWLAPALAVPQITHYILDGFIWRRSAR
ncbi:hypothetical protein [Neorhodopirellula pilleata]|uniref:Uncharacterized protein n=1 Tax=Neorhodopirellula pilleata TaxID=2714738 RepID=A0A5C6A2F4_9BACT|nr:hypothetical protein [Neorhodopirellula pilleata]TWT93585.1 hypothetical protein Pla100_41030 [Neorhodopirellula pilleata]